MYMNRYDTELAVIGAGPAGLCAAIEAARLGLETTIIDEHVRPGGQLLKQIHKYHHDKDCQHCIFFYSKL